MAGALSSVVCVTRLFSVSRHVFVFASSKMFLRDNEKCMKSMSNMSVCLCYVSHRVKKKTRNE